MSELKENHDVFSEGDELPENVTEPLGSVKDAQQEAETQGDAQQGTEESKQQGDEGAEPPAADEDSEVSKSEKMIPESRFKAAIKDVGDKLSEAQRELAAMKAAPRPDPSKDPQGAALHDKLEQSVAMMAEQYSDYDDTILHFQEMAKAEPSLNGIISQAKHPAKMAYDLAKKDMEIAELYKMKDDPDFAEFKKSKAASKTAKEPAEETEATDTAARLTGKKKDVDASKVPNLNRNATSASRASTSKSEEDDEVFAGHYSVG